VRADGQNTTLAMIGLKADNSADYVFYTDGTADCSMVAEDLPAEIDAAIRVLHFGSYSTAIEPTAATLAKLAAREADRRFVSYDPNLRTMIEPDIDVWRSTVAAMTKAAAFVKASDEDIEQLATTPERFAANAIASGADLVCVTLGNDGALAYSADGRETRVAGIECRSRRHGGRGRHVPGGLPALAGRQGLTQKGKARAADLDAMAGFAVKAAAVTCTRRGADLPTLADIDAFGR
jgi:fructokinase